MTDLPWAGQAGYALGWVSFALGHSWLAAGPGRRWLVRRFGAGHRLAYNAIAVVHLALVFALGLVLLGDAPAYDLPAWARWAMIVVWLGGVAFLLHAARYYDLGRLAGTAQWRAARRGETLAEDEDLRLDGPHRWMRHPLYTAGFLILWGRAFDPLGLATAVWGSAYLWAGTVFEERKLLRLYGREYRVYREAVPAFRPALRPLPRGWSAGD